MENDPRTFLWDVLQAAQKIGTFVQDHGLEDYSADPMLRSAVERQFEIIGEALNRLSKSAPDIAARIPDLSRAIAMRNILIHGYARSTTKASGVRCETTCPHCAPVWQSCSPSSAMCPDRPREALTSTRAPRVGCAAEAD
jgi:uncharacterized protein with HEPN domain